MLTDITIKNYRCFADSDPVRLDLRKGFTSLVGPNNSGKSSLLRFFYEFRSIFERLNNGNASLQALVQGEIQSWGPPPNVMDMTELFYNGNDRNLEMSLLFTPEPGDALPKCKMDLTFLHGKQAMKMKLYLDNQLIQNATVQGETRLVYSQSNVFIADLQPAYSCFTQLAQMHYIGAFRNAVNVGTNSNYFDIPVGQSFISTWRTNKTGRNKRLSEAILKLTQDIKRIFGFQQLEINASDDNSTLQFFIDNKHYFLHELGSGIAHFILVLASAAFRRPAYILIDEPETGLHPTLQLDFLTTLGSYATDGIIFSSHSLGLARASSERIYSVQKSSDGVGHVKPFEMTTRLSEFVGELSFAGYKELGFDKILLVEGVTEVRLFQQFLRKYGKDHKVVLIPLGGSQFINGTRQEELRELQRISPNLNVIIDSERTAQGAALSANRQAFVGTCQQLGINLLILEKTASENYLPDRAVKLAMGNNFNALPPYALLKNVSPSWSKSDNWLIAKEMTTDELNATEIGAFLSDL